MTTYGVTPQGYNQKPLPQIIADLNSALTSAFGPINTSPDSVLGQLVGIIAQVASELWQNDAGVYYSQYPSSATGVSLDNTCEIVGVIRLASEPTTVLASLAGSEGIQIPVGSIIAIPNGGPTFSNLVVGAITQTNALSVTYNVLNAIASTTYTVQINEVPYQYTSGMSTSISAIANGLVSEINGVTTDTIHATYLSGGQFTVTETNTAATTGFNAANVDTNLGIISRSSPILFTATANGPTVVIANTVSAIITPILGWSSVNNPYAGLTGRNTETDTELRIRRAQSLRLPGAASAQSIIAQILQNVPDVTNVIIYQNQTASTDGDGRPPHSFETLVVGGDNMAIANEIWALKPAGILTFGNTTVDITDSTGMLQAVNFSRPVAVYIWVKVSITTIDPSTFPAQTPSAIQAAVAAYGTATFNVGETILYQAFYTPVYQTIVANLGAQTDVTGVTIQLATSSTIGGPPGSYSSANVSVTPEQVGTFATSIVTVLVS